MAKAKSFSDGDAHAVFYAPGGDEYADVDGVIVNANNTVTHFLIAPNSWMRDQLDEKDKIGSFEVNTPDGTFTAIQYDQAMPLANYMAFLTAAHTNLDPATSLITRVFASDRYGIDGATEIPGTAVFQELKKYYAQIRRSGKDDDIKEIRPDIGPTGEEYGRNA